MKEKVQQGALKKKWREKVSKFKRLIGRTIRAFNKSIKNKRRNSKWVTKKVVRGGVKR
jgi:hypothetical protein